MSMRAISALNVPLDTVFTLIKHHGRKRYKKLVQLWSKAKELVKGRSTGKIVVEMWAYLFTNTRAFYKWEFSDV